VGTGTAFLPLPQGPLVILAVFVYDRAPPGCGDWELIAEAAQHPRGSGRKAVCCQVRKIYNMS
jgi:hypothetical protein